MAIAVMSDPAPVEPTLEKVRFVMGQIFPPVHELSLQELVENGFRFNPLYTEVESLDDCYVLGVAGEIALVDDSRFASKRL